MNKGKRCRKKRKNSRDRRLEDSRNRIRRQKSPPRFVDISENAEAANI